MAKEVIFAIVVGTLIAAWYFLVYKKPPSADVPAAATAVVAPVVVAAVLDYPGEVECGADRIVGRAFDKPKNFRLSFDLYITDISTKWMDLLHITTGLDTFRLPCVQVGPSSSQVFIHFATPDKWNKSYSGGKEIGTRVWTSFVVSIEGKMMTINIQGQGETTMMLDYEVPPMGAVLCYAGLSANGAYDNNGKVRNIRMTAL